MLAETMKLEKIRQAIEDAERESGSMSDYLDRGNPNTAQAKHAREMMDKHDQTAKALQAELKELIAQTRAQNPQAIDEWVEYHAGFLRAILADATKSADAAVRRNLAKQALEEWQKVRAGEQVYVRINWYFFKDYREAVRGLKSGTDSTKAWWQFWK